MCPRNLSGVGTLSDAGRWSTSSVEIRGSGKYCLMALVYSTSYFWPAAGACANGAVVFQGGATAKMANRIQANGRRKRERADMSDLRAKGILVHLDQAESRATYWRTPASRGVGFRA